MMLRLSSTALGPLRPLRGEGFGSVSSVPHSATPELLQLLNSSSPGTASVVLMIAGVIGYLALVFGNPVSRFFRDGLRCLQRHPRMWVWLSVLGMVYTIFQFLQAYEMGEREFSLMNLLYWPAFKPRDLGASAGQAWLPGLELLAGLFNQAVVSYPTSALAALLFLTNW